MSSENFNVTDDEKVSFKDNGTELKCSGDYDKCVGHLFPYTFKDKDGETYGDLNLMHQTLDPFSLNLLNPDHYSIDNDTFEYNHDGIFIKCNGPLKCIEWFENAIQEQTNPDTWFKYDDGENQAEGTLYFM